MKHDMNRRSFLTKLAAGGLVAAVVVAPELETCKINPTTGSNDIAIALSSDI